MSFNFRNSFGHNISLSCLSYVSSWQNRHGKSAGEISRAQSTGKTGSRRRRIIKEKKKQMCPVLVNIVWSSVTYYFALRSKMSHGTGSISHQKPCHSFVPIVPWSSLAWNIFLQWIVRHLSYLRNTQIHESISRVLWYTCLCVDFFSPLCYRINTTCQIHSFSRDINLVLEVFTDLSCGISSHILSYCST